jgi:hypothetical protein
MFKLFIGLVLILAAIVSYIFLYNPINAPQPKKKKGKLVEPIIKELPSKKPADSYTEKERKELDQLFE